ncbi:MULTISPECIES: phosphodiesterase [Rhodopseudomonas]|uniref:Metallophosphatase n=1 Tax=Rhodopseudomonas palustris TaxID=1076 RepID=A0A0D7EF31_RHOPL|nr:MULTISPECIES: phosphodiesterase [Rhodopseudomonas]KIZ39236.1 metallophosphatase [Rhodopseudomonas palustris]MDF3813204.1 phosphodiesterase [Rhodopseudomonas sp. BAL398]WOK17822.1 phosphodiesterase [Rhodopseudomonas sp. BAL398]
MPRQPILIAQISDLHIKPPGQLAYGRVDTAAALTRCVAALNDFAPRPDLVVISGDLADTPSAAEYDHLKQLLAPLQIPWLGIPGNHDSRALMRAAFPQAGYPEAGALNQIRAVGELDIVLLDSSVHGQPHGELDAATLQWLDRTLAASQRPALLFLHHPPFRTGIWHMDRQDLLNAAALREVVTWHPRVRLVAAGHVHRAVLTVFAGAAATICPAPNHAVALDLAELIAPSFRVEPPAFHLHAWFPSQEFSEQRSSHPDFGEPDFGELVTHIVPIGGFDGPHPFFGPDGKLL